MQPWTEIEFVHLPKPIRVAVLPAAETVSEPELRRNRSHVTMMRYDSMARADMKKTLLRSRWLMEQAFGLRSDPDATPDGDLIWPSGFLGSLSHKGGHVAAVVMSATEARGVGVDLELQSVDARIQDRVCSHAEDKIIRPLVARKEDAAAIGFSIKEAIFKAVFPIGRKKFWFHDARIVSGEKRGDDWSFRVSILEDVGLEKSMGTDFEVHVKALTLGSEGTVLSLCTF